MNNIKKYCIIGASAAGIAAANKLRQLDEHAHIYCFSQELEEPYNKCFLADYIAGTKQRDNLTILSLKMAEDKNIQLFLGSKITELQSLTKEIIDAQGNRYEYDALLLATGTKAFIPPVEYAHTAGVFLFHTLNDIDTLMHYARQNSVRDIVIIGGGITAIEAADALHTAKFKITVVERSSHIMPSMLSQSAAVYAAERINAAGVGIKTHATVERVIHTADGVESVVLSNGEVVSAQLVIIATGQRPLMQFGDVAFAQQHGYLVVDQYQRTSEPDVYAAGDCALVKNARSTALVPSTTWPDAMQQGICAAYAMSGMPRPYAGSIPLVSTTFFGVKVVVGGAMPLANEQYSGASTDYEQIVIDDTSLITSFIFIGTDLNRLRCIRTAYMSNTAL
jgi:nitrite reductase (NADH) large subunit